MENSAKTSMDLVISEKKTPKPGGCVGIFFQLFELKRRLAQNKLFPKKFLPPGRSKRCTEKFRAMEKMPSSKLHLIADENSGGFVNRKESSRVSVSLAKYQEMRAPTLVARLMGLDSMPLMNKDKSKKASVSESLEKGSEREDRDSANGFGKIESRPQKLRKTNSSDDRAVTRFGQEALPFKSVLSHSRKNRHQPKLPSPINTPRFYSGRNIKRTSRLIDAASRLLEPGLVATNRVKSAIAYSNSRTSSSIGGLMNTDKQSSYEIYDSCLGVGRVKRTTDDKAFVYRSLYSNSDNSFSSEMARNGQSSSDVGFLREPATGRMHLDLQYRCPSASSHPRKLRKHRSSSFPLKYGNQSPNQTLPGLEKFSARSEISNLYSGRVSLSANVHGGSKELKNSKFHLEKTMINGREEPCPQLRTSVRKRRMIGASGSVDCQVVVGLNHSKRRDFDYDKLIDRKMRLDPCSSNLSCAKTKVDGQGESKGDYGKNRDTISFPFRSPIRPTDRISATMEGKIIGNRRASCRKHYGLSEYAVGALLEQTRKDDESSTGAGMNVDLNVEVETEMWTIMSKDGNHFSPGSVLEALFSSGSLVDGSGSRLPADIMDCTTDRLHPYETNLFDSAADRIGSPRLNEIIENVSLIIKTIGLSGVRLTGSKLSHAMEVLLFAEVIFGIAARQFIDETIAELLASPLFVDGNKTKAEVQRGFLFDCVIEFMDSKCRQVSDSGFKSWTRLVSRLSGRTMLEDFRDEVREWTCYLEMCLDEMVGLEMSRSTRTWMDFSVEGFEAGADIEQQILQHLVEEILVDMPLKQFLY